MPTIYDMQGNPIGFEPSVAGPALDLPSGPPALSRDLVASMAANIPQPASQFGGMPAGPGAGQSVLSRGLAASQALPIPQPPEPTQILASDTGPQPLIMPPSPAPQMPGMRKDGLVVAGQSSQTSRQQTKFTPEYEAALGQQGAIGNDAKAALDQRAEVDIQRAEAKAAVDDTRAAIERQEEERRAAVEQERGEAIKQAELAWQSKVDKASKFEFKSLWSQKSSGQRGLTMLGMALGAIGAAHTARAGGNPGENPALKVWQREEELDYQKQRDSLSQLKDDALMARTGIADAREARSAAMASLEIRRAARLRQAQLAFDSRAAELGTDAAKADAMAAKAELDMKFNAAKLNALEPANLKINQVTQTQLERPQVQPQGKALEAAQGVLKDDLEYKNFGESLKKTRGFEEVEASLAQAVKDKNPTAINATIRLIAQQINGGVLSDGEGKQLIEQAGGRWDSVNNRISKELSGAPSRDTVKKFQNTIQNLKRQSGQSAVRARESVMQRYGQMVPQQVLDVLMPTAPAQMQQQQQQATPQGRRIKLKDGRTGTLAADGTFYPEA